MASGGVDGTIGGITSTEIPTCRPQDATETVLDRLVGGTWESANAIYVLDDGRMVGRIDVTDLLRSTPTTPAARYRDDEGTHRADGSVPSPFR